MHEKLLFGGKGTSGNLGVSYKRQIIIPINFSPM